MDSYPWLLVGLTYGSQYACAILRSSGSPGDHLGLFWIEYHPSTYINYILQSVSCTTIIWLLIKHISKPLLIWNYLVNPKPISFLIFLNSRNPTNALLVSNSIGYDLADDVSAITCRHRFQSPILWQPFMTSRQPIHIFHSALQNPTHPFLFPNRDKNNTPRGFYHDRTNRRDYL